MTRDDSEELEKMPHTVNRIRTHVERVEAEPPAREEAPDVVPLGAPVLPPAALALVTKIQTTLGNLGDREVQARRQAGKMLVELTEDPDGKYGRPTLDLLRQNYFPLERDSLRPCLELAKKFTDAQFHELTELRGPYGEKLKWTHFIVLSRYEADFDAAKTLATAALNERLTAKDMNSRVMHEHGGKRSQGGRKPKAAKNVTEMLEMSLASLTAVRNKYKDALFPDGHPDYKTEVGEMSAAPRRAVAKGVRAILEVMDELKTDLWSWEADLVQVLHAADPDAERHHTNGHGPARKTK